MDTNNENLYTCRRCNEAPQFREYNALRTHLRVVHRIQQIPPADISLYETYAGSRFKAPPFAMPLAPRGVGVDQITQFRAELVQAIGESVAQNVQSIVMPPQTINVDLDQIIQVMNDFRREVCAEITVNVTTGVKNALRDLAGQLSQAETENVGHNNSPTNSVNANDGDAEMNDPNGTKDVPPVDEPHIEEDIQIDEPVDMPKLVLAKTVRIEQKLHDINTLNDGASTSTAAGQQFTPSPGQPNATSTQKAPTVAENQTKSDDELMSVDLPDNTVTVSQILLELASVSNLENIQREQSHIYASNPQTNPPGSNVNLPATGDIPQASTQGEEDPPIQVSVYSSTFYSFKILK